MEISLDPLDLKPVYEWVNYVYLSHGVKQYAVAR